eukprot:7493700-Pyramimonas_sp.AAC.1
MYFSIPPNASPPFHGSLLGKSGLRLEGELSPAPGPALRRALAGGAGAARRNDRRESSQNLKSQI